MQCPQCGGDRINARHYDVCDDSTGYHDYGPIYRCCDCGAVNTEDEMEAANKERP